MLVSIAEKVFNVRGQR